MLAGILYEVGDTKRARALGAETVELSARGGFPASGMFARLDLLLADADAGDVGRGQAAWSSLWKETDQLRGWHEWLARGRLLQARSELLLGSGASDEAVGAAMEALDYWRRYQRPKYLALAGAALGRAHIAGGRCQEAVDELRRAEAVARRLGHPPTTWRVLRALVSALAAVGNDDGAGATSAELHADIESFASRLSPARRDQFLAAHD